MCRARATMQATTGTMGGGGGGQKIEIDCMCALLSTQHSRSAFHSVDC